MDAFSININGKIFDYRVGGDLDLGDVKNYFEEKYKVLNLENSGRHVLGILEKNNTKFFLKLSPTVGISAVTKNEYLWNQTFNEKVSRTNSEFYVPINYECGEYQSNLFYLITDYFKEEPLVPKPQRGLPSDKIIENMTSIIEYSESLQNLKFENKNIDHQKVFLDKVISWFSSIPESIREEYKLGKVLDYVKENSDFLERKPRHGDFAPWHILPVDNHKLCLIDGEHFNANGVENYDICYFIQRIYCVLGDTILAEKIYTDILKRGYNPQKLKPILLSRAIGGYLDESLNPDPNYSTHLAFQNWINGI